MVFPLIIGLLLSVVALIFAFQNAQPAHIAFLFWRFDSSLALVLVICFAGGLLAGILMLLPARIRAALTAGRRRREVETLQGELAECRDKLEQIEASIAAGPSEAPSEEAAPASGR